MRNSDNPRNGFYFSNFWRHVTNIWTVIFIGVVASDFLSFGQYHYLMSPFAIIYGAVLSIFVGTKEFNRWYDLHGNKRHPGEIFVILWSLLLFIMVILSWISKGTYVISTDVISVYIMVLTIFAITQSSKTIYNKKRSRR